METVINFLADQIGYCDLVKLRVIGMPERQHYTAKVIKIYSSDHGAVMFLADEEISFVGLPTTWGSVPLEIGDCALVFLRLLESGKLYEFHWRGHLWLEEIEGETYAIYQEKQVWNKSYFPEELKSCAREDPKRSYATAIQFDALERYIVNLIAK
jgi:hypothetical protein